MTVYRADLPRTLALDVALPLAVPTAGNVVPKFHSTDPQITTTAKLSRPTIEAAMTTVCRQRRREPSTANTIDRIRKVE